MYFELIGTNIRVLGSVHRFPESKPDLPAWVSTSYDWADCIFTETDDSNILAQFKLDPTEDLKAMLPVDLWTPLKAAWPTSGPVAPLNEFKPWAALLLLPMFCMKTSSGVEEALRESAGSDGKPVRFLERAEALVARADAIPLSEIEAALRIQLSDLTMPGRMLDAIHSAWISDDLAALYEAVRRSPMFAFPALKDALLMQRNESWSATIRTMLATNEKTLIVVGALHLCGPDNLFDHLGHAVGKLCTDA